MQSQCSLHFHVTRGIPTRHCLTTATTGAAPARATVIRAQTTEHWPLKQLHSSWTHPNFGAQFYLTACQQYGCLHRRECGQCYPSYSSDGSGQVKPGRTQRLHQHTASGHAWYSDTPEVLSKRLTIAPLHKTSEHEDSTDSEERKKKKQSNFGKSNTLSCLTQLLYGKEVCSLNSSLLEQEQFDLWFHFQISLKSPCYCTCTEVTCSVHQYSIAQFVH